MRKALFLAVLLLLASFPFPALAAGQDQTQVDVYQGGKLVKSVVFVVGRAEYFVNGQTPGVKMDAVPFIEPASGRSFVPIRYLGYALGVTEDNVKWDQDAQAATLTLPPHSVRLVVGKKEIAKDGVTEPIDVAPILKSEPSWRTYLPARFVAEGLGYQVYWDPSSPDLVICYTGDYPAADVARVAQELGVPAPQPPQGGQPQPGTQANGGLPVPPPANWKAVFTADGLAVCLPDPKGEMVDKDWGNGVWITKNGVYINTTDKDYRKVILVIIPYRKALEETNGLGAYDELHQILKGTFNNETLAQEVVNYVKENKITWDKEIPSKIWSAVDGHRDIYVRDDGHGTAVYIAPTGYYKV